MKYTVITGASSGIGHASALSFAKRGCNLRIKPVIGAMKFDALTPDAAQNNHAE